MRKTIDLMGMLALIFLLFFSLFSEVSFGEILTIKHTVKQTFGGGQSPDDARISAMAKAKREALEKAGTYIESLTVVKNAQVEKDEILALAAGVLRAEVISQKNYHTDDAFGIEIIVNVVVDTSVLEERVKKQLQDREHLTQLKDTQKREKELLQKVTQLEEENRILTANNQSTEKLKKEFQQTSHGLTAVDWVDKALSLWDGKKYTAPKKAIEYLNNAIKLQPDYADAYADRGLAYVDLGHHQRAIEDYNQAIRLQPDDATAYNNRGIAYKKLGQHQRAIEDYNQAIRLQPDGATAYFNRGNAYKAIGEQQGNNGQQQRAIEDYNNAIRLNPNLAMVYNNRGVAYNNLGQYQPAITDLNNAISLQPDLADAYVNRGNSYERTGQYQRAIDDYNEAIHLQPDDAMSYYNRGTVYSRYLGQQQQAIEDYKKAIRLQPDLVVAYNNRAVTYLKQGNKKLGCRDAQKACALGDCKVLDLAKKERYCQ